MPALGRSAPLTRRIRGRFAGTVAAENAQPLAHRQLEADPLQNLFVHRVA
jgi:hypothetical protein